MNTLAVLLKRDVLNTLRNPLLAKARIFQIIFMAIFTGGLYFNVGNKDYTEPISWSTVTGYFFFIGVDLVTQAMTPVALVFPSERVVFLKE